MANPASFVSLEIVIFISCFLLVVLKQKQAVLDHFFAITRAVRSFLISL